LQTTKRSEGEINSVLHAVIRVHSGATHTRGHRQRAAF